MPESPDHPTTDNNRPEPEASRVQLHAIVHGMVQGVGFRANSQRQAAQHDITGWVRNRPDGTVETVAEGTRAAVDAFARWLERGPRAATVDRVETTYREATGRFSGFNIRY